MTSDGAGREADDVAMAGLDPEPRLGRGDRPERGEDLAERHARRRPRSSRGAPSRIAASAAAWTAECWRTSSEARWNPNVPTCQRSSATSPQATRSRPSATSASAISVELGVELGGRRVAPGQWRRLADERSPRPAQPLGDEPEPLAVRLVREAPAELAVGLGQVLGVAREPGRERHAATWSPDDAAAIVCISRVATAS